MTEAEIDALAGKLADLSDDEAAALQVSLLAIRSERARREEERLDRLRAMTDWNVVYEIMEWRTPESGDVDAALAMLRDAGFVRGATLHQAYRAGYERYGYEHLGDGHPLQDEDAPDFTSVRDYDLAQIGRA